MPDETNHSPRDVPSRDPSKGKTGALVAFPQARERPPDNLPLELSSFIGREKEVAEVKRLLTGHRLVSLCGPGGCGKTRLALAVAQDLLEGFEDGGVWWVELASLSDSKLVSGAVASALGVREVPDRSPTEVLVEHLESGKTLLVLDSCEHLVEGCAVLADILLRACQDLEILATSREPLRVSGEATWAVPSLSLPNHRRLPPTGEMACYEAIRLFVERAEAADAGFALTERNASAVALLCHKLDGIPLAIELAAARVRTLTVEQISEKLEDPLGLLTTGSRTAPPRHQTLRATLQWSYELLSEQEQELLNRLSVFVGGWDLEAAEAVGAAESVEAGLVLDLLSNLVDKSLVVAEESEEEESPSILRYRMLEPVRQYAREKLEESTDAPEVRRRHAEHYLAFAERAEPELLKADQGQWLRRLRTEFGNLRGALSWSLEPGEEVERAELRLRLAAALWWFWGVEGFEEGKRWLQTALDKDPGGFPAARAKALGGLGFILLFQQAYGPAIDTLEEAIALYKDLGDESGAAFALANLGYAMLHGGFRERVAPFVQEAEALMQEDLDNHARAYLRMILAAIALLKKSDLDSVVAQLEESLALCRELGDMRLVAMSLLLLGIIELARDDLDRGATLLEEGARIPWELKDRLCGVYYVWVLGKVNALRRRPVRAARLWGAAEGLRERMGMSLSHFDITHSGYEQVLAFVRSTLDEASFDAAWTEGRAMSPEQAIEYALDEPLHEEIPAEVVSPAYSPVECPREDGDRRHNLPVARSGFVGREREISEVERTLSTTRLLTLTGAGGCGKTRLALEVARDLADAYPDGLWLVELASLSEGALVPGAVASALGVREQPNLPFTDTLVDYLRSKRILLVLDNCEHLVEACARLVDTLLGSCEHLRVLATSREALEVAGETNYLVPSLTVPDAGDLPDPQALTRYEAVQLFVERARSRLPTFDLMPENAPAVVDICRKLDGIPLAIELATARMGALAVGHIAERLENSLGFLTTGSRTAAPRQRTLRATLAWSYDLLSEPERNLFGRLSVFAGGWALEAAEAVGAGEPAEAERVLDLLSKLVDKSLVVAEAGGDGALRYRMLEPVRQYALERLLESGEEEAVRRAHAEQYLALAEEAEPRLTKGEQVRWLNRLENEHGNLGAALSWSLGVGAAAVALRLCGALWRFWYLRGHLSEGRRWLERTLALDGGAEPLRAGALSGAGHLAWAQGDHDRAQTLCEESLALSRRSGHERGVAESLNGVAFAVRRKGDYARGYDLHEEALEVYRGLGDEWGVARSVLHSGTAAAFQGDHAAALPRLAEALRMFREIGDRECIAEAVGVAGMVDLARGEWGAARSRFEEAQAVMNILEDRRGVAKMIAPQGDAALSQGDHEAAYALYHEALTILRDLDDKWWTAWCLEGMAGVAAAWMQPGRAARLFGAVAALRDAIRAPRPPAFLAFRERNLAAVRDRLGEEAFEAAWTEGQGTSPREAIEYALSEEQESASAPAMKKTSEPLVSSSYPAGLSAREAEVLKLVAEGLTNARIAERLFISPRTVDRHLNSVYHKIGVRSRAAATRFAIEHGLA